MEEKGRIVAVLMADADEGRAATKGWDICATCLPLGRIHFAGGKKHRKGEFKRTGLSTLPIPPHSLSVHDYQNRQINK